jgi:hypothetical protein
VAGPSRAPTEDQARAVLAGWARRTHLVPNTLFDGPLVVAVASVVWMQVARLIETRTETPAKVPGTFGQRATYTDLRSHRVEGDEGQELNWSGVRQGSVTTEPCNTLPRPDGRRLRTVKAGAGKAIVRPADVDLYQLVPTGEQAPDLSLLPVPAQAELTVELARPVPGERRRKVQLLALPVVAVTYHDDGPRTAYLLGQERRARAPGAGARAGGSGSGGVASP